MYLLNGIRKCISCGFERTPVVKVVKKGSKHWAIFTCRMCNSNDIEEYTPKKVWNGWKFEDEIIVEEDDEDE